MISAMLDRVFIRFYIQVFIRFPIQLLHFFDSYKSVKFAYYLKYTYNVNILPLEWSFSHLDVRTLVFCDDYVDLGMCGVDFFDFSGFQTCMVTAF